MKVRATKLGYYGDKRQRPGDIFHIDGEAHFSKRWMEKIEAKPMAKKKKKKVVKKVEEEPTEIASDSEVI